MENKHFRYHKIIVESIEILQLNLDNITVLTEVASGLFLYTPIIAALAGAKRVYAVVNDSIYGKAEDIIKECLNIARFLNIDISQFEFSKNNVPITFLQNADIVTNSGHLRPLNEEKLKYLKPCAAIPIMYEKWELRTNDIDVAFCKKNNITIAGTWENHPDLQIFDFCKHLMLKIIFEAGYEIKENNIIIFSSDHYGVLLKAGCEELGANNILVSTNIEEITSSMPMADFIFFCDYNNLNVLLDNTSASLFNLKEIKKLNKSLGIIHLAGAIDMQYVNDEGFHLYPNKNGYVQKMTQTLAYLGPKPLLLLQTAGLKVGQELFTNTISNLSQI